MSNEAVIIELFKGENPIQYTCADGVTIGKGDLLILADPNTVTAHSAGNEAARFAGIAAAEKVASDGRTTIAAHVRGIFDLRISGGSCTAGDLLVLDGTDQNCVNAMSNDLTQLASGALVGKAQEDGGDPETIRVLLGGI